MRDMETTQPERQFTNSLRIDHDPHLFTFAYGLMAETGRNYRPSASASPSLNRNFSRPLYSRNTRVQSSSSLYLERRGQCKEQSPAIATIVTVPLASKDRETVPISSMCPMISSPWHARIAVPRTRSLGLAAQTLQLHGAPAPKRNAGSDEKNVAAHVNSIYRPSAAKVPTSLWSVALYVCCMVSLVACCKWLLMAL